MVATRFRIHGDDDPVKPAQLRHARPLPRRHAPPSRDEEDLANVVWAKAGPFASLGTAYRRAFALAHCNQYKSERLYCQYRRSLFRISQRLSGVTPTSYSAFRLTMPSVASWKHQDFESSAT